MTILETLADELAQEALALEARTGNGDAVTLVAEAIGASSTTMEEAYLTAVRVRRAEARGRAVLARLSGPEG